MDLSVIIVNYRGWDHLSACLNALKDLKNRISSEVIIVDNNSSDGKLDVFLIRIQLQRLVKLKNF